MMYFAIPDYIMYFMIVGFSIIFILSTTTLILLCTKRKIRTKFDDLHETRKRIISFIDDSHVMINMIDNMDEDIIGDRLFQEEYTSLYRTMSNLINHSYDLFNRYRKNLDNIDVDILYMYLQPNELPK